MESVCNNVESKDLIKSFQQRLWNNSNQKTAIFGLIIIYCISFVKSNVHSDNATYDIDIFKFCRFKAYHHRGLFKYYVTFWIQYCIILKLLCKVNAIL